MLVARVKEKQFSEIQEHEFTEEELCKPTHDEVLKCTFIRNIYTTHTYIYIKIHIGAQETAKALGLLRTEEEKRTEITQKKS